MFFLKSTMNHFTIAFGIAKCVDFGRLLKWKIKKLLVTFIYVFRNAVGFFGKLSATKVAINFLNCIYEWNESVSMTYESYSKKKKKRKKKDINFSKSLVSETGSFFPVCLIIIFRVSFYCNYFWSRNLYFMWDFAWIFEKTWRKLRPLYMNYFSLNWNKIINSINGFLQLGFSQCLGTTGKIVINIHIMNYVLYH